MPSAKSILDGLAQIANGGVQVAIGWHVVVALAGAALLLGVRPQQRVAAVALSVPLGSVGVLALSFRNPFNGAVFSVLAIVLAVLALRAPRGSVAFGSIWSGVLGATLVAFGFVYPHFLEGGWFRYLYAAPLGTVPCPTLSLVVGSALIADGFGLRVWRLLLAAAAGFYSLFGVFRLGVLIDVVLLVGAIGLVAQHLGDRSKASPRFAGTPRPADPTTRHSPGDLRFALPDVEKRRGIAHEGLPISATRIDRSLALQKLVARMPSR